MYFVLKYDISALGSMNALGWSHWLMKTQGSTPGVRGSTLWVPWGYLKVVGGLSAVFEVNMTWLWGLQQSVGLSGVKFAIGADHGSSSMAARVTVELVVPLDVAVTKKNDFCIPVRLTVWNWSSEVMLRLSWMAE
jgi:hypothetical protein